MTRVLIATDEPILAKGLEAVLIAGGVEIVAVCHDVFELFEGVQRSHPDIAVLDTSILPAQEVVHDLKRLAPNCQLVVWPRLTMEDSPASVAEAILHLANSSKADHTPSALVSLACNASERELIALVGYGLNYEEIANAMGSDQTTVQKLLKSLSDRLGIEDRYELALYGLSTMKEGRS